MTTEATPGALGSHAGLGLAPEREAFERWCAANGHGTLDDMMAPIDRALKNLLWSAWCASGCVIREEMAREELECVRQALPDEWRGSVPSVAVATLAAELDTLRQRFYTTRCPAAHLCDCQEAGKDCARGYRKA